jgi:cell division protein FtsL
MKAEKKALISIVLIGIICVFIVVLSAYAAELRVGNNEIEKSNQVLKNEIDTLDVQIKSATSSDYIQSEASSKLGMTFPDNGECIFLSQTADPLGDLAMLIKDNAYN